MTGPALSSAGQTAREQVLGYLNFSSGQNDPKLLASLDLLCEELKCSQADVLWAPLAASLSAGLSELSQANPAFQDTSQAEAAIRCTFECAIPAYLEFHKDLLEHQDPNRLMNPFMVGFVMQAVLSNAGEWQDEQAIAEAAVAQLNDYVGYRPVPQLESRRIDLHPRELVRPTPLYVREAGVVRGPHYEVVTKALDLLQHTDAGLLRAAHFDPELLDELCYDPRAYDFEHPANKRPNYHFGLWDPRMLDNQGRYRRFVVQEVTLQALMSRLELDSIPQEELVFEAASVLAGTILMASGICGSAPDSHDSSVSLSKLLPLIAQYRDAFYQDLFQRMTGEHAQRLNEEASKLLQPFGGARQHLNAFLARQRASQVEHVHLSRIFAKMGHFEAAQRQANIVPVASARMRCRVDCQLTAAQQALDRGDAALAAERADDVVTQLHTAIECGAMIDPWNILGFDSNFSVFQSLENSFHDHRSDELIELVEQIFATLSRVWSAAAAVDDQAMCERVSKRYLALAEWWHQFAVHEVSSVEAADSLALYEASRHVAKALGLWHQGGAATGDVKFWAEHAMLFKTAQSHALVINALLDRGDFVASMALLVHWLGQAESIPLEQSEHSFHRLARRWLQELQVGQQPLAHEGDSEAPTRWQLVQKFLDFLEANAGDFWSVPSFDLATNETKKSKPTEMDSLFNDETEQDGDDLFDAAYEDVTYRDSTDDGVDGSIFDTDSETHSELAIEANRIANRLEFLCSIARLWRTAIVLPVNGEAVSNDAFLASIKSRLPSVNNWVRHILRIRQQLDELVAQILAYKLPTPSFPNDTLSGYDQHFVIESLLERVVTTSVEIADAGRILLATTGLDGREDLEGWNLKSDELHWTGVFAGILQNSPTEVRQHFSLFVESLRNQPLLYVPLNKGGAAHQIISARIRQRCIQDLLVCLPKLGLFMETCELIEAARAMERDNLVGPGAVTEFDELFKIGYKSLVTCLVEATEGWSMEEDERETALVNCLEQMTESMLVVWLAHSRTLRLSVLERVSDRQSWDDLIDFITKYGEDLFTQRFLSMGNLRAVLHQGVDEWLETMQEEELNDDDAFSLVEDLDKVLSRREAADQLSLVIEAVVENYAEYRDYNSTTTQSDRGDLLYSLLDFLRLRTQYDRVCWNLKPVVVAHAILERRGHTDAARTWRRALVERVQEQADQFLQRLEKLQRKYAMKMPTVADRIGERFVRPLAIDRIRALVEPAIEEAMADDQPRFELLEHETDSLTREPSGVGLDIPAWIVALDDEVERMASPAYERDERFDLEAILPPVQMSYEDLQQQLDDWTRSEDEV